MCPARRFSQIFGYVFVVAQQLPIQGGPLNPAQQPPERACGMKPRFLLQLRYCNATFIFLR